jgi:acyl dehydratase
MTRFADVSIGTALPSLSIPLTRTLITATAIATRDYNRIHHDPGFAHDSGSKDIIMNILTTNGFVGRFVTDWAGSDAIVRSIKIRLGVPNYPGDTMTLTGEVTALDDAERLATVAVRGSNSLGDHVTGTVEVVLP